MLGDVESSSSDSARRRILFRTRGRKMHCPCSEQWLWAGHRPHHGSDLVLCFVLFHIFLITTSQLLSRDGRLIRATVLLANGRARGCCASALLRREEEGFQRLRSKTSLLVAVFSDFRGDKGTKSCQFIRRKFPNLWSHIYSSIFDIFDMHNSCVLAVVSSISIGEPPGWDWRGSKMAVLKYLICGYLIGQKWLKMAKNG